MKWNFQKIVYFLVACDEANLSEAAKKLFVSPQGLNAQLKSLEEDIGEKLIERNSGSRCGMKLTRSGEKLRECFRASYLDFQMATRQMERYLEKKSGVINLAYFRGVKRKKLLAPLCEYMEENWDFLDVELHGGELGDVLDWVMNEKCDIGITNIHEAERKREGIVYVPITKMTACVVVSKKHPWAKQQKITAEDMRKACMLVARWNERLEEGTFWKEVAIANKKMVADYDTMIEEVKTGKYFIVFPSQFEGDLDEDLVKFALPEEYQFHMSFCLVYKKGNIFESYSENIVEDKNRIWNDF